MWRPGAAGAVRAARRAAAGQRRSEGPGGAVLAGAAAAARGRTVSMRRAGGEGRPAPLGAEGGEPTAVAAARGAEGRPRAGLPLRAGPGVGWGGWWGVLSRPRGSQGPRRSSPRVGRQRGASSRCGWGKAARLPRRPPCERL